MKKKLNNLSLFIFVLVIILICFIVIRKRDQIDSRINQKGVYCIGWITRGVATKGGVRAFHYSFLIQNKKWQSKRNIPRNYFEEHKVGDTIVIKTLLTDLPTSLICEDKNYDTCLGKQPANGWKKLPKCN